MHAPAVKVALVPNLCTRKLTIQVVEVHFTANLATKMISTSPTKSSKPVRVACTIITIEFILVVKMRTGSAICLAHAVRNKISPACFRTLRSEIWPPSPLLTVTVRNFGIPRGFRVWKGAVRRVCSRVLLAGSTCFRTVLVS